MYTKRRRKPNRWAEFDYNSPAFYFITICTANRRLFFGKIENNKMILNKFGQIARDCWLEIVGHFDGVELGEFVIMPNHVHGIVFIVGNRHACSSIATPNKSSRDGARLNGGEECDLPFGGNSHGCSVQCDPCDGDYILPGDGRQYQELPKIIGAYKSSVSRRINKLGINIKFGWHKSYYDHIIRNEKAYYNIKQYIINNPSKWHSDRNNIF